jgi:hypothetical protein
MNSIPDFFQVFKLASEEKWRTTSIRQDLWGFQFQPGTRWNRGLSDAEIAQYEAAVGARFPLDFRLFLRQMNGTDKPTLDIRGVSGEPHRHGPGFYSFPADLERVRQVIDQAQRDRFQLRATLKAEEFELSDDANLIPIFAHRFVVCDPASEKSPVLSIYDADDAIIYGNSLQEYLEGEILRPRLV